MAVISRDLGPVTAYAAAVNRGYTGTREEFETLMASYATVAQEAGESASAAADSASDAELSASAATTSAGDASSFASAANASASNASNAATAAGIAQTAAESARNAAQSAQTAAEDAREGAEAAVDGFDTAVTQAISDVNTAGTNQKELAKRQAEKSEAWAVGQISGEDVGVSDPTYHNNAKYYAESAGTSATTATTKASEAAQSASSAAASASAAAASAQTLVTDTTLTQEGQAADAKVVGNEIEGIKNSFLGAETIEFTTGGYIATIGNVTSSVDFTPVTSVGYRYAVVNCNAGDRFIVNGNGGGSPRLWAFVDGANKMISHAEAGVTGNNLALVAPFNAKKLIINDNFVTHTTPQISYALKSPNVSGVDFVPSCYIKTSGGVAEHTVNPDGIAFTKTSSFYSACAVIPCKTHDRIILTGTGGSATYLLWAFVDSNGVILKSSVANATLTDGVIFAPDGTSYCIINVDTRQTYNAILSGSIDVFGGDVEFSSGRIVTSSLNTRIDYTPVTDATFEYAIVDCVKGQHFTITGTTENNSGKRLYCFVDLNGYVRDRYNETTSLVDADVVAPISGKLVVNSLALYNHYIDTHYPYSLKNSLSVLPPNYLGALSYRGLGPLSKGYICMMTDDGYDNGTIGLVQDTIPFAIAKDIPFTFALMRDSDVFKDDTKLAAVIDAVENHGCSVAQHGEFTWNGLTEEMLNTFFDLEKAFFDANGIDVKGAVIPAHYTTELIKAVCGGRFGVVRSGYSGIVPGTQDPSGTVTNYYGHYESGPRSNLFCLSSYNCSGVSDAYNQQSVDFAYDNHTIMIVYFHENAMDSAKWQTVSNLVDYAKTKGLTFCTLGEIPYLL